MNVRKPKLEISLLHNHFTLTGNAINHYTVSKFLMSFEPIFFKSGP